MSVRESDHAARSERDSATRAPYGRVRPGAADGPEPAWQGQTYYDRPAVKPSLYGWRIILYFFLGGLAGVSQIVAAVADFVGRGRHTSIVRAARYLSLGCAAAGPSLLIADLHTPGRWYNMFRIFRRTSPMSIGSWTLGTLGVFGGMVATAQTAHDRTGRPGFARLARWASVPAAGAGGLTAVYTGSLIAATSTPLWSAVPRTLPALFGASAVATTAAALTLASGDRRERTLLGRVGLLAGLVELALTAGMELRWRRLQIAAPLDSPPLALAYRGGGQVLGMVLPLVLHATGSARSSRSSRATALATLAGGIALRAALVFAGNASARRPRDYFRLTQPQASRRTLPP